MVAILISTIDLFLAVGSYGWYLGVTAVKIQITVHRSKGQDCQKSTIL